MELQRFYKIYNLFWFLIANTLFLFILEITVFLYLHFNVPWNWTCPYNQSTTIMIEAFLSQWFIGIIVHLTIDSISVLVKYGKCFCWQEFDLRFSSIVIYYLTAKLSGRKISFTNLLPLENSFIKEIFLLNGQIDSSIIFASWFNSKSSV